MVRPVFWLRRRFIAGFFVTVPLIISVAALVWIFHLLDNLTDPLYARLLGREVPGLGLLTTVAFVLLVGVAASNVLGKQVLQRLERYLLLVPVFRTVYSPVKQLVVAFSPDNESGLKRVVIVEDHGGTLRIGFVTREFQIAVGQEPTRQVVAVYVPTNHLYLGDVYLYRPESVIHPDFSVEEGVRIILTGGMSIPEHVRGARSEGAADDGSSLQARSPIRAG